MTTIDKLGILGIRSYGTDEETLVRFYKPLTILLGRNGSGKSTIIEAIKMATTGDLPPLVDKGAAFIHDPRIDNETETKAKIRLLFTNVRGDQYIVARHFQLSLKKLPRSAAGYKPEFKTLDQTLKKLDNQTGGSARAYRSNDLNTLLPDVMRVSKPVLNNVIFVHQEDSLWPLSDSKKLKEKFDEIFAATRYTKALDVIRKYRKDQAGELRTVNVELMHYEDKVKRMESVRREVDEIQVRHDELKRGVNKLDNEIATLRQEAKSAELLTREYSDVSLDLEKLRMEVSHLEKRKEEKYRDVRVPLTGTDDNDIREQIEQLQISLENTDREDERRSQLIRDLNSDIEMKRTELDRRLPWKGKLEQQAKGQRDRLEKLEQMKNEVLSSKELREQLNTTGEILQLPSPSDSLERWSQALDGLRRDADAHVNKLTQDGMDMLDAASANCTDVKVRLEAAKAELARRRSSVDESRKRLVNIRSELRELEQFQVSVKDAEGRMKALQTALHEKQQSGQIKALEGKISDQRKEISSAIEDLDAARRTRDLLLQDQEEQTKLEVARHGVRTTQIQLNSSMEELAELQISAVRDLAELDTDSTALESVRSQHSSIGPITDDIAINKYPVLDEISTKLLAKRDLLIEQAERKYAKDKSELHVAESQKHEAEQRWVDLGSEVRDTKTEIHKVIKSLQGLQNPPEELKTLLSSATHTIASPVDSQSFGSEWFFDVKKCRDALQTAISKAEHKVSQQETGLMLAIGDLEQFEDHPRHMCPACGMVSSKKVDVMRENLQNRIEIYRDPERLTIAKRCLEVLENSFKEAKHLDTLTASASELNSKLRVVSVEKDKLSRSFETARTKKMRSEAALSRAKQLNVEGNTQQVLVKRLELKQLVQNFKRAQEELDMLQTSLSVSREDERSLADVNSQVQRLESDLKGMQETLDRTQKSLDSEKDDLRRVEMRFYQAKQLCDEQATKTERHKSLVSEKESINTSLRNLEEEIEVNKATSSTLKAELREAEEDFQRTRGENAILVDHARTNLSKRLAIIQAWAECQREIDSYKRSGKDKELQTLLQSLEAISSEVSSKTADLRKHEKEQRTAADTRNHVEQNLRNLRANQEYRLLEQELQANARSMRHVEDKLSALKQKAGELPSEKLKRLTEQVNVKNSELHATMGRQQGVKDQYKDKRKELNQVENEGSRRKFDECRIKKQTMQLASSDLDRYHRALDQALMAFHTLKMNSINRTIKELWQQTYRGTDIEEIEITSDHGDGKTGAVKRNFNYRVQMRQGGAVLDMRGRCSAGQKVLACLVIRLALAESFCADCGILALDEPTTNLDRENIESLAAALKTIIDLRRKQRSFQLILITHDQDFIEMLGARDFCNEYYTVYKDGSGLSRAKLQDLRTML